MVHLDKKKIEDILPLTSMQEGMLFHYLKDPGNNHYFEELSLRISHPIDTAIFEKSWNVVIRNNEMLRTVFRWEKIENPVQIILKEHKLKPLYYDLSNKRPGEKDMRLQETKLKNRKEKFDLNEVPFRVILCKLGDREYEIIISNFHILYDGWSTGIILREFFNVYEKITAGKRAGKQAKTKFKEYIKLHRSRDKSKEENYWKEYLYGYDAQTGLSIKRERKGNDAGRIDSESYKTRIKKTLADELEEYAGEHRITLAAILYGAVGILLQRYNNSGDVIFGTTVSGRSAKIKGIENIVGLFINTLPLRFQTGPSEKTGDLLQRIDEVLKRREEHEHTPLVEIMGCSEIDKSEELFDTIVVIENYPLDKQLGKKEGKIPVESYSIVESTHYTLTIGITLFSGIELDFIYEKAAIRKGSIVRMAEHFVNVIKKIIRKAHRDVSAIEMMADEEKRRVLYEFNETNRPYPADKTIHRLFEEQVEKTPYRPAVVGTSLHVRSARGSVGAANVILTYEELNRQAGYLAHLLREKNVQAGTIIGIMVERSVEMFPGILGIWKTGGAYLPIDPGSPEERIKFILADSGVRVLVTTESAVEESEGLRDLDIDTIFLEAGLASGGHPPSCKKPHMRGGAFRVRKSNSKCDFRSWKSSSGQMAACAACPKTFPKGPSGHLERTKCSIFPRYPKAFDDEQEPGPGAGAGLAYVIYTSGTTGNPKGVLVRHDSFVNAAYAWREEYKLQETQVNLLQMANFTFDVFAGDIARALLNGGKLVICPGDVRIDPPLLHHLINKEKITLFESTPALILFFMEYLHENGSDIDTMRLLIIGSDILRVEDFKRLLLRFGERGLRIINSYGVTEATIDTSYYEEPIEKLPASGNVPIGRPMGNMKFLVLDASGRPQPIGIAGELYIAGAGVAQGYLNQQELTNEKFIDIASGRAHHVGKVRAGGNKYYKTGDLARWQEDGNIEFLGRADYQVKIRGFRIELGEIENQLLKHKDIKEAAVIALSDKAGDNYLCAYIAAQIAEETPGLRQYLSRTLPEYMVPGHFVLLEKLPRTASGKIDRKALPEPEITSGIRCASPRNRLEKHLAAIWAGVLSIGEEQIGIDSSFFRIGGHSLKATLLSARIHKELDVKVSLKEIFDNPTIRELAGTIKAMRFNGCEVIERVEKKEYYTLSSAEKRLFILQQIAEEAAVYNMPGVFEMVGTVDKQELEHAFAALIKRHESLRTSFHLHNGEPVRRIHGNLKFEIRTYDSPADPLPIITNFVRPFDLSHAPLLRVGLVNTAGSTTQLLMVDMHHIIADGISHSILVNDFMAIYGGKGLSPLNIQYKDFSNRQNIEKEGTAINTQEKYWKEQFAEEIPALELPLDFIRPTVQSFAGSSVHFTLNQEETAALKKISAEENVTVFMILMALYNVFLAKISGREIIVVGTPSAGRSHTDMEPLIGMFVNVLAMRNEPRGEKTFRKFLEEVSTRALAAFENQDFQYEDLVEAVHVKRDAGRNPLFDTMFAFQNLDAAEIEAPGLRLKPYDYERKTAKFDLTLEGFEVGENLEFELEYCTKLFLRETIQRFSGFFRQTVSAVVKNPDIRILEIDIVPEEEKWLILDEFNKTGIDYPADKTIHEIFEEQAAGTPDQLALISVGICMTYRELNRRSTRLAIRLREKKVEMETIAGILTGFSVEMITGILAILKSGGAYLPIDPGFPEERIKYMLADSSVKLLLTTHDFAGEVTKLQHLKIETISIEEDAGIRKKQNNRTVETQHLASHPEPSVGARRAVPLDMTDSLTFQPLASPGSLAYIMYTSGSTGNPKGVMVKHKNVVRLVKNTDYVAFEKGDRILQTGALTFDASTFEIWGALLNGLMLYQVAKEELLKPEALKRNLLANRVTTLWMTAAFFNRMEAASNGMFSGLKNLLVGGDILTPLHINRLKRRFSRLNIINGYGPTENTTFSTTHLIEREYRANIPIGRPIANSTAYIVGANNILQPIGVPGELIVGGDGVSRGYLNDPELTFEKFPTHLNNLPKQKFCSNFFKTPLRGESMMGVSVFIENDALDLGFHSGERGAVPRMAPGRATGGKLYKTGDLARWLPDGTIEFLGRKDTQVKLRGYRIELEEIENQLLKNEEVKEAVVLLNRRADGDKYLCAYIVAKNVEPPGGNLASPRKEETSETDVGDFSGTVPRTATLKEQLSHTLPHYMIPSYFVPIEKIPLTPNGKVDRKALPAPLARPAAEYTPPASALEKIIAGVWKEVLELEEVGIHDNIFEVGGNSLNVIKITEKLKEKLNKEIPVVNMFRFPTIYSLVQHINRKKQEGAASHNEQTEQIEKSTPAAVAVIGMAGRFPGAENIEEFFRNLRHGVESIAFFSDEELEETGINPDIITNSDYIKAQGILEDADCFDAGFFDYTPMEAMVMDPQMRLFHECAYETMENAGYDPGSYKGAVGVYAGISSGFHWQMLAFYSGKVDELGEFTASNLADNHFLSTRLAYKLNLRGPANVVQTACSTSLVAIHQACRAILAEECHMALAGGVSAIDFKRKGFIYREGMVLSSDGHCRAFAANAGGTADGSGVGIVLLKSLEHAVKDRDHIYAVVKGSATNNDGSCRAGYTAPGIEGQAAVIRAAMTAARVQPASIGYVEAHGTGTGLGDPVEIEGLKLAFQTPGDIPFNKKHCCAVGSVKTNIGHLDSAAGVAGFIKAVLSLKHRILLPTLHYQTPNPKIDFENSPFYVVRELTKWEQEEGPLRAGVSSFGIGGTNAHVILEEYSHSSKVFSGVQGAVFSKKAPWPEAEEPQLILLSAKTPAALEKMTKNLATHLDNNPGINLADTAYTLQVGRKVFPNRRMFVCGGVEEALRKLTTPGSPAHKTITLKKENPAVIFMFSGLGTQFVNMGRGLYETEKLFRDEMDRCFEILEPLMDIDVKKILYPHYSALPEEIPSSGGAAEGRGGSGDPNPEEPGLLTRTEIAQPLLFMIEYALAKLLIRWGIEPEAMIGYSFGEYVAAAVAGVFTLKDALKLIVRRGQLVEKVPAGAMLSVPLPEKDITQLMTPGNELSLAVDNGDTCIVSGPTKAIDAFKEQLRRKRLIGMNLENRHAFHSKMMAPILKEFTAEVARFSLKEPAIPYISNVTGAWISHEEAATPGYWAKHIRQTVRFADGMKKLLAKENAVFIEIGPGKTLTTLSSQLADKKKGRQFINLIPHPNENMPEDRYLTDRIGRLWTYGVTIDWLAFYSGKNRHRIPLPAYPFAKRSYRLEGDPIEMAAGLSPGKATLSKKTRIKDWFYVPSWKRVMKPAGRQEKTTGRVAPATHDVTKRYPSQKKSSHENKIFTLSNTGDAVYLLFIDESGPGERLAEMLREQNHTVITVRKGTAYRKERSATAADGSNSSQEDEQLFTIDPQKEDSKQYDSLFAELEHREMFPDRIIHLWNVEECDTGEIEPLEIKKTEAALESGYYSLINIARAIGKRKISKNIRLTVVTSNMQEVTGGDMLHPEKVTVLGPVKVIPLEYANINCRAIDIDLNKPGSRGREEIVERLLDEITAKPVEQVAAIRGNYTWLQTYEPVQIEKTAKKARLRERGIYVITGGLGGIGLTLAGYLARSVRARLVLTGRSEFPGRDRWEHWQAEHAPDDGVSKTISALKKLEKAGADILILQADVVDRQQMEEVFSRAAATFGPVNGVIHSAGLPDGEMIQRRTRESSLRILETKIHGTLVLDRLLKKTEVDFFVLCSSLNSILPEHGQVAYAAANAFLDAYALSGNNASGRFTAAIDWDRWREVGMSVIAENLHKEFTGEDMAGGMTAAEAVEAFDRILHDSLPHTAVSTVDLGKRTERWQKREEEQLNETVDISYSAGTLNPRPELSTTYVPPRNKLEQILSRMWREYLGIEPIGIYDDFFDLGGDSLKGMILVNRYNKLLQETLPVGIIFSAPTIAELSAYIGEQYPEAAARVMKVENRRQTGTFLSIKPVEKREYYRLSSAQKRLYFLRQMNTGTTAYNVSLMFQLGKKVEKDRIELLLKKLVERHESLRTSFPVVEGEPVQRIHDPRDIDFKIEYYGSQNSGGLASGGHPPFCKKVGPKTFPKGPSGHLKRTPCSIFSGYPKTFDDGDRPTLPEFDVGARRAVPGEQERRGEPCVPPHMNPGIDRFIRPFDLSRAPLLRSALFELPGGNHTWLVDIHHIISDGTSATILAEDFISLYKGEEPASLPIHYKDYSAWQNRVSGRREIAEQEDYWQHLFTGEIPVLDLPADFERPAVFSFEGAIIDFDLTGEDAANFKSTASANGSTLYMNVLAALNTLFYKYTGQTDIIIGTVISGRRHADIQRVLGMFANTLTMRNYPADEKDYSSFLKEVSAHSVAAFENQDVQFETLVEKLDLERDPARNPLFDISMVLQDVRQADAVLSIFPGDEEQAGFDAPGSGNRDVSSKFDMTFSVFEKGSDIHIEVEYYTGIFKETTIKRLITHFRNIIKSVNQNPFIKLEDIEIMSTQEKREVLFQFNETATAGRSLRQKEYREEKTLHRLFEEQAAKTPDHTAIEMAGSRHSLQSDDCITEGLHITYGKLDELSGRQMNALRRKGIKSGAIVALMIERSLDMVVGVLAVLKAGGAYLPIEPDYPEERKRYMIADSGAERLLTSHGLSEVIRIREQERTVKTQNLASQNAEQETRPVGAAYMRPKTGRAGLAYILYTSGTTGRPRGVMIEHRAVVDYINWAIKTYVKNERLNFPLFTPLTFDLTVTSLFTPLLSGNRIVVYGEEESGFILNRIVDENRVDVIKLTPSHLKLIREKQIKVTTPSIKRFIVGGEELETALTADITRNFGGNVEIYNEYGPTETAVGSMIYKYKPGIDNNRTLSIGKPADNTGILILDKNLKLLPVGVQGEICILGVGMARGYLNQPELTAEKFASGGQGGFFGKSPPWTPQKTFDEGHRPEIPSFGGGPQSGGVGLVPTSNFQLIYRTGDLGRWQEDGNIEFIGRIDHQVKIRGFRIELGEIESQLLRHEDIKEAVVIAYNDKTGDNYLCAYITAKNTIPVGRNLVFPLEEVSTETILRVGARSAVPGLPEAAKLREYLSQNLPDYMIPAYFVEMAVIPLTANGKVDRKALPEPEKAQTREIVIAPRDGVEETLAEIWSEVLGISKEDIGINHGFFHLGGHSLKAFRLTTLIHKKLGAAVPIVEIFKRTSIREQARFIKEKTKSRFAAIKNVEERRYYPTSPAQKRLYLLQQMAPDSTVYHIPAVLKIEGRLQIEKLENVFRKLIERHGGFRTSFTVTDDQPVQRIHNHQDVDFKIEYYEAGLASGGHPTRVGERLGGDDSKMAASPVSEFLFGANGCTRRVPKTFHEGQEPRPVGDAYMHPEPTPPLRGTPPAEGISHPEVDRFIRPFDLSRAPLLRVGLVKPAPGSSTPYIMVLDMHHIISDGLSMSLLIEEFTALYAGKELPVLQTRYKDYSEWRRSKQSTREMQKQEEWWTGQFRKKVPVLELPYDYQRPQVQDFAGSSIDFELGIKETAALKELALKEETTLFLVLAALFNIMLSKTAGSEDILIGTPIAGRKHAGLERIIGMFVNTLTLRNFPLGEMEFITFLHNLRDRALQAFDNQDYPFEDLVEQVAKGRDTSRNPLFDVMFAMQDMPAPEIRLPGLRLRYIDHEYSISKFDLTLTGRETGKRLGFTMEYSTKLFKEETILRFKEYFKNIAAAVVNTPYIRLSEIEIISEEEKERILTEFNGSRMDVPGNIPIQDFISDRAAETPDRIAVSGTTSRPSGGVEGFGACTITYKEMDRQSGRLSRLLTGKGVGHGAIAGIMAEQSAAMITGILAILKTGAAFLPIDPAYPEERTRYMLADSAARLLLTTSNPVKKAGELKSLKIESIFIEAGEEEGRGEPCVTPPIRPNLNAGSGLAYVIYTSGTTGRPRGVLIEHRSLVNLCAWHIGKFAVTSADRATKYAGFGFDASVWEIFPYLTAGASLHIVPEEIKADMVRLNEFFEKKRITIAFLPTQACEQFMKLKNRTLRILLTGGDKLREYVKRSYRLVNNYGPTENTVVSTAFIVENEYRNIPIGKPVHNNTIFILNRYGKMQPVGIAGELCISGAGLSRGYLNNPELTDKKFIYFNASGSPPFCEKVGPKTFPKAPSGHLGAAHLLTRLPKQKFCSNFFKTPLRGESMMGVSVLLENVTLDLGFHSGVRGAVPRMAPSRAAGGNKYYKTGDLARWQSDGDIEFLGRIDNQVKIRGYRIELGEIESRLLKHEDIKEAVVISHSNKAGDNHLCAYITAKNLASRNKQQAKPVGAAYMRPEITEGARRAVPGLPGATELREYLSRTLPAYMIPANFVHLDELPLTPNGKIDRKALPQPGIAAGAIDSPPKTGNQVKLAQIWAEVLGIAKKDIGIESNFFEIGGHSLKAAIMTTKIHKEWSVKIPLTEIFKQPTIRELAEYIEGWATPAHGGFSSQNKSSQENKISISNSIDQAGEHEYRRIEPVEKKEYYELSSAQKRLYILQQMEPASTGYNIPGIIPLKQEIEPATVEKIFRILIARHESLRTSFHMINGEPVQRIDSNIEFKIEYFEIGLASGGQLFEKSWTKTFDEGRNSGIPSPGFIGAAPRMAAGRGGSGDQERRGEPCVPPDMHPNPFDLSRAPILRVGLIKLPAGAPVSYILIVDMHHIITDGTSVAILEKEFATLLAGESLPQTGIRYRDYANRQNRMRNSKFIKNKEKFWMNEFFGEIPVLELPADYDRPENWSFEGSSLTFDIDSKKTRMLTALARDEEATVYMVLLAVIKVLMAKLGNCEEVVIGSPVAGRSHADLEHIIGLFVNTLPLRGYPAGKKPFRSFLREVKAGVLGAIENQEYQFEDLVEKLSTSRDTSRNPLFDVMFTYQNIEDNLGALTAEGLENGKPIKNSFEYESRTAKFDMHFIGRESQGKLFFGIEYGTKLFKPETIEKITGYMETLIESVLQRPGALLCDLEIQDPKEKERILYDFNDTKTGYPAGKTVDHVFAEQAAGTPDRTALAGTSLHASGEGEAAVFLSYRSLNEQAGELARLLRKKGAGRGTIVGIMVERSLEMMTGLLAILKSGSAYLPIDPGYPQDRIDYMLKDSGAKILFAADRGGLGDQEHRGEPCVPPLVHPESRPVGDAYMHPNPGVGARRAVPVKIPSAGGVAAGRGGLAYVIYTSGSTGKPKGVMIEHRSLLNFFKGITDNVAFKKDDIILSLTTISFDIFGLETLLPLTAGTRVVIGSTAEQSDPAAAGRLMERENVTMFQATPSRLQLWLPEEKAVQALTKLRYLLVGGEAFPLPLLKKLQEITPAKIINLYGPTETTIWSTLKDVSGKNILNIGKPIANTRIFILGKGGEIKPVGVAGELCIGGDGLSPGYLNKPELTDKKFPTAWGDVEGPSGHLGAVHRLERTAHHMQTRHPKTFVNNQKLLRGGVGGAVFTKSAPPTRRRQKIYKTGDLARWLPDGNIEFLGRMDYQVKIRGFRVELEEIETQILEQPGIEEAVVLDKSNKNGEKYLCAYILTGKNKSVTKETTAELRKNLSLTLPHYMIPSHIAEVDHIPLTPAGKIDRRKLSLFEGSRLETRSAFVPPGTGVEKTIARIWKDVLKVDKLGINDNFFELGGNSLDVVKISNRLETEMKRPFPVVKMFKYPTIRTLAGYFSHGEVPEISREKVEKKTKKLHKGKDRFKERARRKKRSKT